MKNAVRRSIPIALLAVLMSVTLGSGLAHAQSGSAGCSIAMMKNRCPAPARANPQDPRGAASPRRTNRAARREKAAVAPANSMARGLSSR